MSTSSNAQILCETSISPLTESRKAPRSGVLRELSGTFSVSDEKARADNRNGRLYSSNLLRNRIIESPYTKDMMERGCLFGEADHPSDRLDIRMSEVSHRISNLYWQDGEVKGVVEILDTPVGRVVDTLCEVGAKIAISSRAAGSTVTEGDKLRVQEDGYAFYTYDLVLNPGFKSAILQTNESFPVAKEATHTSPEQLNALVENAISSATAPAQLEVIESLLQSVDPKVFSSSISSLRERRLNLGNNANSDKHTLSLIESVHRDLSSERSVSQSLRDEVTSLQDKVEELEFALMDERDSKRDLLRQTTILESVSLMSKGASKANQVNPDLEFVTEQKKSLACLEAASLLTISQLQSENSNLEQSFESLMNDSKEKESEFSSLSDSYKESVEDFESRLQEAISENEELSELVESLRAQVASVDSDEVESLQEQLEEAESELLSLRESMIFGFTKLTGSPRGKVKVILDGVSSISEMRNVLHYFESNKEDEQPVDEAPITVEEEVPVAEEEVVPEPVEEPVVQKQVVESVDFYKPRRIRAGSVPIVEERTEVSVPSVPVTNESFDVQDANRLKRLLNNTGKR